MEERINLGSRKGFTLFLEALPEDTLLSEEIDLPVDTEQKVEQGILVWFMAKVTAERCGIELGCDYLGGCLYDSVEDFIATGDYIEDMKDSAVYEAQKKLNELRKV